MLVKEALLLTLFGVTVLGLNGGSGAGLSDAAMPRVHLLGFRLSGKTRVAKRLFPDPVLEQRRSTKPAGDPEGVRRTADRPGLGVA